MIASDQDSRVAAKRPWAKKLKERRTAYPVHVQRIREGNPPAAVRPPPKIFYKKTANGFVWTDLESRKI